MDEGRIEQRVVDLELRYMRAEKMLQDLSDVIILQQKAIDRLTSDLASIRERVPDAPGDAIPNERPPHY